MAECLKYKTTTGKYKIIFVGKTRLTEFFDDTFPWMVYDFKAFQAFSDIDSLDESMLIGKNVLLNLQLFLNSANIFLN